MVKKSTKEARTRKLKLKSSSGASKKEAKVAQKSGGVVVPKENPVKEPETMEELLAQTGYRLKGVKKGEVIQAVVVDITPRGPVFDVGAKMEAVIGEKEHDEVSEFVRTLKPGNKVSAYVLTPENDFGQVVVSLKKAAAAYRWQRVSEHFENDEPLQVRVLEPHKGGYLINVFDDLRGFLPLSQIDLSWQSHMQDLINRLIMVKVLEVDAGQNRLVVSERALIEEAKKAERSEAAKYLKAGDRCRAEITGLTNYGVFAKIKIEEAEAAGKMLKAPKTPEKELVAEGLVHISEASWEKVDDLSKIYKIGEEIEVVILGEDKRSGRLNLSIKQLTPNPWEELITKYQKDQTVAGKIAKISQYGAFVELEPGIVGLLHITKIPAGVDISEGEEIEVMIESIDIPARRVALSMVLKEKPVGYK